MQINNVRRGDAGTYMCTASNNVGTMSADEIDLRILCKLKKTRLKRLSVSKANCTLSNMDRQVFLQIFSC